MTSSQLDALQREEGGGPLRAEASKTLLSQVPLFLSF